MDGAKDDDGGVEAAICSSGATSSTLDDNDDDDVSAEAAGVYPGVSSLPWTAPEMTRAARRMRGSNPTPSSLLWHQR
jgi:hypothetical protein